MRTWSSGASSPRTATREPRHRRDERTDHERDRSPPLPEQRRRHALAFAVVADPLAARPTPARPGPGRARDPHPGTVRAPPFAPHERIPLCPPTPISVSTCPTPAPAPPPGATTAPRVSGSSTPAASRSSSPSPSAAPSTSSCSTTTSRCTPADSTTRLDAALVAARLAPRTQGIGLVAAVGTTHTAPAHISTAIATIDQASAGRAGWQVGWSTRLDDVPTAGPRATSRSSGAADATATVGRLLGQRATTRAVAAHGSPRTTA